MGTAKEGEFRSLGRDYTFVPMRAPASGSAIADDLPDVLLGSANHGFIIAAECKYRGQGNEYVREPNEKVDALLRFADQFHDDCVAVIATRWYRDTDWYIHEVDGSERNEDGHFNCTREKATGQWPTFEEYVARKVRDQA